MSRLLLALILGLALTACPTENLPIYDFDGDGFTDETDCVVDDDSIFPGAPDAYGDGIDQNCDGADGTDVDGDGFASEGGDCNDSDASIHPDAEEIPGDGIDNDCDGMELICDADADGVLKPECGGTDCDDANAVCVTPADCADDDGDGWRVCDGDCDDLDPAVFPGSGC
jgi:hypothetical protein